MRITNETVATFGTSTILKVTVGDAVYFVRAFSGRKVGPAFDTFAEAKKDLGLKKECSWE